MSHVATYSGPHFQGLRGMGAQAICLDQAENTVSCQDPECTYGDCGAVSSYVPSGGCLDRSQNQVLCMDPACTYGDCLPPTPAPVSYKPPGTISVASAVTQALQPVVPRPSPTVSVPLSTGSVGMFLGNSTLIAGLPNWALLVGTLAVAGVALGGSRRRR